MSPLESPCPIEYCLVDIRLLSQVLLITPQLLPCYTLTISQGLPHVLVSVSVVEPCSSVPCVLGVPCSDTAVLVLIFVEVCMIYLEVIRAAFADLSALIISLYGFLLTHAVVSSSYVTLAESSGDPV
jgi:hypothetical protein